MGLVDAAVQNAELAAAGLLVGGFLYMTWCILYNLYFHPLAKYPGPLLARISPFYSIYGLYRGRWPFDVHKLHKKYGPILRLMPNELAFIDPQAWKDIYGHRQGHPQFHKSPIHVGSVEDIPGSTSLTMSDDETHSRQRRVLAHAFSQKALLEQESIIRGYVDLMVEKLTPMAQNGTPVNLCNWFNFATFDIVGDMAFGQPFGCLRDGIWHDWVSLVTQTIKAGAFEQMTRRVFRTGSWPQKFLLRFIPADLKRKRVQHLELSREKALQRIKEGLTREHNDFLYYILRANEKGAIKQDEIILNSALFIVAGSETTASLLSGMAMWLMRTPSAYKKLTDEIRGRFSDPKNMKFADLQEMTYMNACIDEALRIFPPLPTGLTREVPKGGDTVAGEFLPESTTVAVYGWSATHSELNFTRPDEFIPERWIDPAFDSDKKEASQPFSLGPRGCIGRHLTYLELRLILANLLWHFDIVRADGDAPVDLWDPEDDLKHIMAFNTWNKPPLMSKLIPVKR